MEKKTYPSGVITPELGSTNWYSDYDTNSSLLDSNITKTNSLDGKVKELETSYTNVETSLKSLSAVAKSGDYNDLSNKPESIALAEKAVADGDNNVITKTYATKKDVVTSLEPYIKKTELADVATSGSYTDLSDKPTTIAHADRSTADNNGDVITETYAKKTEIPNLDGYALSKDISKVGKTNNYKDLDNLPTIPSLDGYVTNVELSPVAKSGDYNDLSNTPEPVDLTPYATKKELGSKADDANVVHKSGTETIVGTKTFSSQIKGSVSGTSSDVVVGSDTATARGYLVDANLPWYTWEEGSKLIAGRVPLITDFNNLIKPGVYHVIFCLNDGYVHEENEYKESLNRPSIPNITTGFRDGILEIKETTTMYNISSYPRFTQKLTLLSSNTNHGFNGRIYQRVCINLSNNNWTAWKRVAIDEEVVHTSGNETISGAKTFKNTIFAEVGGSAVLKVADGPELIMLKKDHATLPCGIILRSYKADDTYFDFKLLNNGSITWNNANIITDNNQIMVLKNLTGAQITPGAVIDCGTGNGVLVGWFMNTAGAWTLAGINPKGKWKNANNISISPEHSGIFVKVG